MGYAPNISWFSARKSELWFSLDTINPEKETIEKDYYELIDYKEEKKSLLFWLIKWTEYTPIYKKLNNKEKGKYIWELIKTMTNLIK